MIGAQVSRYRVLSKLGGGGMGVVYEAEDLELGRRVALKFLPDEVEAGSKALERFRREARAASALNHPGICVLHDIDEHEGRPFLVLERLEGHTLAELLHDGPLPVERVVELCDQIADALDAAHRAGIVHRDLKPANLFVTQRGQVKILDFGLARIATGSADSTGSGTPADAPTIVDPRLTETGAVVGTVAYMSPEQARGQMLDARSDLFSLGIVLYEATTGRLPFAGSSAAECFVSILTRSPPPPGQVVASVPGELDHIVLKLLEKSTDLRYQSAAELRADLRRLARDTRPTGADPSQAAAGLPSSTASAKQRPRRSPLVAAILALVALVALVAGALWLSRRGPSPAAPIRSLAVLPLVDLSPQASDSFLADGMTEALITRLAQIRSLKVISRTSIMRYKMSDEPLRQIAAELGVDGIVEGSILRSGDRVRVSAQLIRAAADTHLWANAYERELREVLSLQADLASAIAHEIEATVLPEEAVRLAAARPVNPETYQLVLRGRDAWNQRTPEGLAKAEEFFRLATESDPNFAPAWDGLADANLSMFDYGIRSWEESTLRARAAATRALELDESLAAAHTSLGHIHLHEWRWAEAEQQFGRAVELDPSYVPAHHWFALCETALGRTAESVAAMQRAFELDPLSVRISADLGMAYLAAGRYGDAIDQENRTLVLAPNANGPRWIKGLALQQMGRLDEAAAEIEPLTRGEFDASFLSSLANIEAAAGRTAEARAVLAKLLQNADKEDVTFFVALVYAGLGETENALDWLERAVDARSGSVRYLEVEPRLATLRSEPRFRKLLERVGLPT